MAKTRITKLACEQAMQKAQFLGQPVKLLDDKLTGFGFRAAPRGEKASAFFVDYRLKARGPASSAIPWGSWRSLPRQSARKKAQQVFGVCGQRGIDVQFRKAS